MSVFLDTEQNACSVVHVTIVAAHETRPSSEVTSLLQIEPTDPMQAPSLLSARPPRIQNVWRCVSTDFVESRDFHVHLDCVLQVLAGRTDGLGKLRSNGWKIYLLAYWSSLFGHGGPSLSAAQARALGDLDIDIDFDVYFSRGAVSRGSSVRERASSPPVSNRPPGPQEPGLDRARGSSLRRSFIPAFAIVRIDDVVGSGGQEQAVTVKKIVADLEEARSEVDRLNQIHSEKSCFYSWHNTKIEVEVLRRLGSSDA